MREVLVRPRAQLDIESSYLHIAVVVGSPQAAQRLVDEMYAAIESLAEMPERGERFNSTNVTNNYRRILVRNRWVYYTYDETTVTVWRVFHTSQDIDDYAIVDV